MNNFRWLVLGIGLGSAGCAGHPAVSEAVVERIIAETSEGPEVRNNIRHLSNVIGPRLTGSPELARAHAWARERFESYGLRTSSDSWALQRGWRRGPATFKLTAPFERVIFAASWCWTAGTGGQTRNGPVVWLDVTHPDSVLAHLDDVRGAWLLTTPPLWVWNPDGPAMSPRDSARMVKVRTLMRRPERDARESQLAGRIQFDVDLPFILHRAGALGILYDSGKEFGLLSMTGGPSSTSPLPQIAVSHEDYLMLAWQAKTGKGPRVEAWIENEFIPGPIPQQNTVAELTGTEWPEQVVVVGAHLDSYDIGTGATDNAAGVAGVLQAARLLANSGVRPKRTIQFVLFSGEEQGFLGAKAYLASHPPDSIQAMLNFDDGTGAIQGIYLQGRQADKAMWERILEPLEHLGAHRISEQLRGGGDHLAFFDARVPAWSFEQRPRGITRSHHSQVDTYDHVVVTDLQQAAAVLAVAALALADHPERLARGRPRPPLPIVPAPSPEFRASTPYPTPRARP